MSSISEGYNSKIESEKDYLFPQLKDIHYVDHAATTPYSKEQLAAVFKNLEGKLYGNPHCINLAGAATNDKIDSVRALILQHFHVTLDEYSVVFTAGATAALKLVSECFQFTPTTPCSEGGERGCLAYLSTSAHTSVVGMREACSGRGAAILPINFTASALDKMLQTWPETADESPKDPQPAPAPNNSLFVHPGQCNFSGRKYPLQLIPHVRSFGPPTSSSSAQATVPTRSSSSRTRWFVMLDAASLAATDDLDLARWKPDFVAVSFYKIFGFPTGLGALIVKNTAFSVLKKTYFGGGSIEVVLPTKEFVKHRRIDTAKSAKAVKHHLKFEDGTVNFLDIIALPYGFQAIERFGKGMSWVSRHVFSLRKFVIDSVANLRYPNCQSLLEIYEDHDDVTGISAANQGGILAFNVFKDNGEYIGYSKVDRLADIYRVIVRTGDFCNQAAAQHHLRLSDNAILTNHKIGGHVTGDNIDLVEGRPTGAVRVSFGYSSVLSDVERLVAMLRQCFLGEVSDKVAVLPHTKSRIDQPQPIPSTLTTTTPLQEMSLQELLITYSRPDVETFLSSHDPSTILQKGPKLEAVIIYPIKSCGAFLPSPAFGGWLAAETGLAWDRNWLIARFNSQNLSQKREGRLAFIRPFIDLERGLLIVHSERSSKGNLLVPLTLPDGEESMAGVIGKK